MKWLETIEGVGEKYALTEKQRELLGTETTLVLLCVIPLGEYEDKLTNELALPPETIEKILVEITDSVLKSILPELIKTYEVNSQEKEEDKGESMNYSSVLQNISRKNGLNVEEMGKMEKVVAGVIEGEIRAENMASYLSASLPDMPQEKRIALSQDINEQILKKIREKMQKDSLPGSPTKEEADVLESAGIEILPDNGAIPTPKPKPATPVPAPAPREPEPPKETLPVVQTLEIKGKALPVFAQKLGGAVQTQTVKTEHTIQSSSSDPKKQSSDKSYPKGQDPYRLPPI